MRAELKKELLHYLDYLMENSTPEAPMWNIEKIKSGKPNKWNYCDGCVISSILTMYKLTGEKKYLDFADNYIGWFVNDDGTIKTYDPGENNLDNINPGKNLFMLYDYTGNEKYRKALDTIRGQLDHMPRTKEGNFWHKEIYPWQVWLDGMYMAEPFYLEYEMRYNRMAGAKDVFTQFKNVERLMRDPATGLYYHGYDESRSMYWADPVTGCSSNFWLRAEGWFAAALVDTAAVMNESLYYEMDFLIRMLRDLADSLKPYQDDCGMFYQVIDKGEAEGNYLETSGTALIAYALVKAVNLGFLPQEYADMGEKAFNGIIDRYFKIDEKGNPELGGICLVAGLGGDTHRDGSLKYYFSEPVVKNEAKGLAPLLMAFVELAAREDDRPKEILTHEV